MQDHLLLLIYVGGDGVGTALAFCSGCFLEAVILKGGGKIQCKSRSLKESFAQRAGSRDNCCAGCTVGIGICLWDFDVYNAHPPFRCISKRMKNIYTNTKLVLPMYNVHPYFSLKNLNQKVCIIHGKILYNLMKMLLGTLIPCRFSSVFEEFPKY